LRPIKSNIVGKGPLGQALRNYVPEDVPIVFFCVKAHALQGALIEAHALWPGDVPFVTLSNGFFYEDLIAIKPMLLDRKLRLGMTTMGATIDDAGVLRVFSNGSMVAWGNEPRVWTATPITSAESNLVKRNNNWKWVDDMTGHLRTKWIFNTTINTVCAALTLKKNGFLTEHRSLTDLVFSEAYRLAGQLWPQILQDRSEMTQMNQELWGLIDKTAENENSMMRDVRLGRRTEAEYLSGFAKDAVLYPNLNRLHGSIPVPK